MNLKKRVFSLFLSVLLLTGSMPTQAFSFKGLWNRYANKKTFSFLVPATLILGGLVYLWLKHKGPKKPRKKRKNNRNNKSDRSQMPKGDYTVKQVPVLDQRGKDVGGSASCGYQSIKNFKVLSEDITQNDKVTSDGLKRLKNSAIALSYFSCTKPHGAWRIPIIKNRPECKIMNKLSNKFGQAFRDVGDITDRHANFESNDNDISRIRGIYRKAIGTIIQSIKETFIQGLTQFYDLSNDTYIINDIIGLIDVRTNADGKEPKTEAEKAALDQFNEYLKQEDTVKKYIDFKKLRNLFKCSNQDTGITLDALIDEVKGQMSSSDQIGEWLDGDEVKMLMEQQVKQKNADIAYNYTVLDDTNNIGKEGFCLLTPAVRNEIKPNILKDEPYTHGIFIGTMQQQGDKGRTKGHWLVVVLHKNKDGKREYIIADSLNTKRVNDEKVKRVIDCIEANIK